MTALHTLFTQLFHCPTPEALCLQEKLTSALIARQDTSIRILSLEEEAAATAAMAATTAAETIRRQEGEVQSLETANKKVSSELSKMKKITGAEDKHDLSLLPLPFVSQLLVSHFSSPFSFRPSLPPFLVYRGREYILPNSVFSRGRLRSCPFHFTTNFPSLPLSMLHSIFRGATDMRLLLRPTPSFSASKLPSRARWRQRPLRRSRLQLSLALPRYALPSFPPSLARSPLHTPIRNLSTLRSSSPFLLPYPSGPRGTAQRRDCLSRHA